MPALKIFILNGKWVAIPADTNVVYTFAGEDLEEQKIRVRALAHIMKENQREDYDVFFEGPDDPEMSAKLFGGTDSILLEDRPIFTTVEGPILDELQLAGNILLEMLDAL